MRDTFEDDPGQKDTVVSAHKISVGPTSCQNTPHVRSKSVIFTFRSGLPCKAKRAPQWRLHCLVQVTRAATAGTMQREGSLLYTVGRGRTLAPA